MMYRCLILVSCWLSFFISEAQSTIGIPDIINYEKHEYNGGAQNWDIKQDVHGVMYFANNEGLIIFDGTYWKLYPLPNKTIVRSIEFGADKRIYIGGQDEIGYFSPDVNGMLYYSSLKTLLPVNDRSFADIWDVVSYGNDIFFRSTNKIFQLSNNKIRVFGNGSSWSFIGISNKQLVAQNSKDGILVFNKGNWATMIGNSVLPPDFNITSCTSFGRDSTLLTSQKNGLFILTLGKLVSLPLTGSNTNSFQFFSGCIKMDEETFVIGTYTNGLYIINKKGRIIQNLSRKTGLQNNNVRSLFSDKNHNVWLGLDSGVDFIAYNNGIKHINPANLNDGAGYASLIFNKKLYIGLSNGIYQLPLQDIKDLSYSKSDFTEIAHTEGQTWGLSVIHNNLLAGRDEGLFQIRENSAIPVLKGNGFWTFQLLQENNPASLVLAGNYLGLRLLEFKDNTFIPKEPVPGFSESARYLAIDQNNIIWASHPYRGVYKIQLTGNNQPLIKLYTSQHGLPSTLKNHVYKVKDRIVVATENGIYEYNSSKDSFETSGYFRDIFGETSIRYLKDDPNGNLWFIHEKNLGVVDFSAPTPRTIYLPELKGKMVSGFEHVYPINNNNILVGAEKGFYHINYEKYKQQSHELHVYIRTVEAIGKTDSLLFGGYFGEVNEDKSQSKNTTPIINHYLNSFHLEYSSPVFELPSHIEYSYYLHGFDKDWSEWSKKTEKEYTNLPAGVYDFSVKARNNLGNESVSNTYSFTVLPPWYKTFWAYLFYMVLASVLIYLLYRRQQKRFLLQQQKHQEEQKRLAYLHQLEMEKSEKEIVKLRNEKLESEIEFKNSELASNTMHLLQKGELLTKIKDKLQSLNKHQKSQENGDDLKKIIHILSEEEKIHQDWDQFAIHFNKVHSNFLIMLKEKYPELSAHELKLCAYLRMNLSSKEIAQLMNISVRGVEISRYRLRKKLQIPTEINLFQFLLDIHFQV